VPPPLAPHFITEAIQNGPDTPIPQGIFAIEHLASSLCIQLMDGSAGHGKGGDATGHRRRRSGTVELEEVSARVPSTIPLCEVKTSLSPRSHPTHSRVAPRPP